MKVYNNLSYNPSFSHIYVEKEAKQYAKTREILAKFPQAQVIEIENYQDVFHASGQDFSFQKQSQKLILAVKHENFLYPGAKVCEAFEHKHFYYSNSILNCIYDCHYCYLQGVHRSANIVIFVNIEDFFQAVEEKLLQTKELYLCISYDTDLLALEGITSFVEQWYDFSLKHPSLSIELRTKSAKRYFLEKKVVNPQFIFAWTLSPSTIVAEEEKNTPSLEQRLLAIRTWQKKGFSIRLCFDPLLWQENFVEEQKTFLKHCFSLVNAEQVLDVSVGTFRVSKDYLKKMRKQKNTSLLLNYPFVCKQGVYSYPTEIQEQMFDSFQNILKHYVSENKIFIGGTV